MKQKTKKVNPDFIEGQFLSLVDGCVAMVVTVTDKTVKIVKLGGTPEQTFKSLTTLASSTHSALHKKVWRYDGVWIGTRRILVKYGAALLAKQ